MRTETEILKLMNALITQYSDVSGVDYTVTDQAELAIQALSWVLGDKKSPEEILKDLTEDGTRKSGPYCLESGRLACIEDKDEF